MSFLNDMFGGARSPVLLEAADYADMFSDVTRALKHRLPEIEVAVNTARESLKKNDRVVWYLRMWKVGLVQTLAGRLSPNFVERVTAEYARRSGMTESEAKNLGWTVFNDANLLPEFQHFLSLSCPAIQHRTFGHETPERLLHEFRKAEKAWQGEIDESFEDTDAHEIMRFPNGLAWFNLGRASCDREGHAMGHGGNTHRRESGDTLLSLRQVLDHGTHNTHKPLLTFVLDENGLLGEMKGRFNQKPEAKYYNEIVALLHWPMVHGIKGGGYKPENNFHLSDLDENTRASLLEEKPELAGLFALYKKFGAHDDRVMSALEERLHGENIRPPMLRLDADGNLTLEIWADLEAFATHANDGIVLGMVELLSGHHDHLRTLTELNDAEIGAILSALSPRDYAMIMRTLQVRALPDSDPQYQKALMLAAQRFRISPMYGMLVEAANDSLDVSKHHGEIERRLNEYIAVDWSFGETHQWVEAGHVGDKVALKIRADDLIAMVTATDDDHADYIHALHEVRENHWGAIDRHDTAEKRAAAGLSPELGYEAKHNLASDSFFATLMSESLIDYAKAGTTFMRKIGL